MAELIHGKIKKDRIYQKNQTLTTAQTVVNDITPELFPDGLIHGLTVELEASAVGGLTAAAATWKQVLRGITYGAGGVPKFNVMTNFRGIVWDTITTMLRRRAMPSTTPAAATGFKMACYLPFSWDGTARRPSLRAKDTGLLNLKGKAKPFVNLLLGAYADLGDGNANVTCRVTVYAHYEPHPRPGGEDPVNPMNSGDEPTRYLSVVEVPKADLSSDCELVLNSGGPRENIGVFMIEENSSTGALVTDIFNTGIATPSVMEVVKGNSDVFTSAVEVAAHDRLMDAELEAAVAASYHPWIAAAQGKLLDSVPLNDGGKFAVRFRGLSTTATRVIKGIQIDAMGIDESVRAGWAGNFPDAK